MDEVARSKKNALDFTRNSTDTEKHRKIPYTKIGGVHFYDYLEIQKLLENGKVNRE